MTDSMSTALFVFSMAVCARFGWMFAGYVVQAWQEFISATAEVWRRTREHKNG